MNLRLLEGVVPRLHRDALRRHLEEAPVLGHWIDDLAEGKVLVRALLDAEHAEEVVDHLDTHFGHTPDFRLLLLPVEATLPRPGPPPSPTPQAAAPPRGRISREELYADVEPGADAGPNFLVLTGLATVVAVVGLLRSNPAVVIGAMVIAPLLGPILASSLAVTVGDGPLWRRAVRAGAVGTGLVLALSVAAGAILPVDPGLPEIASRTRAGFGDLVLALAAGAAGALSATGGTGGGLIGVMVAVALLPPLVTAGLLAGSGHWADAGGAGLLFVANWVCLNLAGVITFLAKGVRPHRWWEAEKAKKAVRRSLATWGALLVLLALALAASRALRWGG
ncbi:MAG: TIGR00341 family protein [Candidatus Dadabacteria bacterium]|nr:MAG: TIGR00341 family protein [Candidatus Dadabacteria bacterium]